VTWATLLVSKRKGRNPPAMWRDAMQRAADAAFKAYRGLIEDPGFVDYFASATPIDSIESLQIGSRPARRRAGDKPRDLSCLRAIPYTFAWTQSRHLLTAFFGLGSGLIVAAGGGDGGDDEREDWSVFREMYAEWPFFRAVIDNAELALAKCDTAIAGAYAALVVDRDAGDHIYTKFRDEYARSRHAILQVTGQEELLAGVPWLQRSITVRNPYVDALNLIQVELMRRLRAPGAADAERETLAELLRLSIQGVAAGLRTTG
jgi:phosphoenolpyruvate carboxylase